MTLNLSETQIEFLYLLLYNKQTKLEKLKDQAIYQIQRKDKFTNDYYQNQLKETEEQLVNVKSILEVLSNNKIEISCIF